MERQRGRKPKYDFYRSSLGFVPAEPVQVEVEEPSADEITLPSLSADGQDDLVAAALQGESIVFSPDDEFTGFTPSGNYSAVQRESNSNDLGRSLRRLDNVRWDRKTL